MDDNWMTRIGKRGLFLLIMGASELARGYGLIVDPVIRRPGVEVLHDLIPIPWYGLAWMVCGLVGCFFAFSKTHSIDAAGFVLMSIPPAFTALSYIGSWVLWLFTGSGDPRGWVNSILFVAIASLVALISGWAEPKERLPIDELRGVTRDGE